MLDRVRTAEFGFPTDGLAAARLPVPRWTRSKRPASRSAGFATTSNRPTAFALWRSPRACRLTSTTGNFASPPRSDAKFVTAHVTRVGENFLETIGAPLRRGRTITAEDRVMAAPVAVISEPLAAQLFPGKEAIGERVTVTLEDNREQEFTVVGVTADFATSQLTTVRPQILLPLPEALGRDGVS